MTDKIAATAEVDPVVAPSDTSDLTRQERIYMLLYGIDEPDKARGVSEEALRIAIRVGYGNVGVDNTEVGPTITEADTQGEQ